MDDPKPGYWTKKQTKSTKSRQLGSLAGWGLLGLFGICFATVGIWSPIRQLDQPTSKQNPEVQIESAVGSIKSLPQGFKKIELAEDGIRLAIPESWVRWEDQYFRDARVAAASLTGESIITGEPVYSAASVGAGGLPLVIVQILKEKGPAPTQTQIKTMVAEGNSAARKLPELTPAEMMQQEFPGISLKVLESGWADNGMALCQYVFFEALTDSEDSKFIRQWQCFNSSSIIWLSVTSPSAMDGIYAEISSNIWKSFEFTVDQTPRLR